MTEKLFYQDSYMAEFEAQVLSCIYREERYEAVLDRTAFFPEGGGQSGDEGKLWAGESCARVLDVQEKDGQIFHYLDRELLPGTRVRGELDFEQRFSKMQQHTGEHILSGIAHSRYGYRNVGFHLGSQEVTMDYDGPLTQEQLLEMEDLANRAVFQNIPVRAWFPSPEELERIPYRSKMEIPGRTRLVEIPGYDCCACCAPHVKNTGSVGLIKITGAIRYKGGMRLWIQCGSKALLDYRKKEESVVKLSNHFSAKQEEVYEAALRVEQELLRQKEKGKKLQKRYVEECLDRARERLGKESGENLLLFLEELDPQAAREFVNQGMELTRGFCGVFTGNGESWSYILGSRALDIRRAGKALNESFQGKGGGRPPMIQGSLTGSQEGLGKFFEEYQEE